MTLLKYILCANLFLLGAVFSLNGMMVSDFYGCFSYNQEESDSWMDRKKAIEVKIKEYMTGKKWHNPDDENEIEMIYDLSLRLARCYYDRILEDQEDYKETEIISQMIKCVVKKEDIGMVSSKDVEKACYYYHKAQVSGKLKFSCNKAIGKVE